MQDNHFSTAFNANEKDTERKGGQLVHNTADLEDQENQDEEEFDVVDASTLQNLFGDNFLKNCKQKAEQESIDNHKSTDRVSKQISDQDVKEALYGLPFADERYEEEIKEYL